MKQTEVIKLIGICSANYKNWPESGKEEHLIELWEMMLSDLELEVAKKAIQVHLSRSVFPPTVADIRDAAAKITNPRSIDAIEAWGMISEAIRKFGFYRQAEAMDTLPADVVRMVKQFTWRELCYSENIDTMRAQFRMAWETQNKRLQERNILPDEIVHLIDGSNALKRLQ